MRNLVVQADANGDFPTWCRVPSDTINAVALNNEAKSTTVPAGAGKVFFSSNADFTVKFGGTAAWPTTLSNGTASELNPACYKVTPGDVMSIFSSSDVAVVTLSYYR